MNKTLASEYNSLAINSKDDLMISCEQQDYVEIACMYNYLIKLTLKSGEKFEGIAFDVKQNKNREECINIRVNDIDSMVVLDSISQMEVLVDNPHFKVVTFKN